VHGWWWDEWKRMEAEMQGKGWWETVKGMIAV